MSHDQRFGKLFSVSLISTIVLNLDVKVQWAFTTVNFLTTLVWANEWSSHFFCCTPVVLLSVWFLTHRNYCMLMLMLGTFYSTFCALLQGLGLSTTLWLDGVFLHTTAFLGLKLILLIFQDLVISSIWFNLCPWFTVSLNFKQRCYFWDTFLLNCKRLR